MGNLDSFGLVRWVTSDEDTNEQLSNWVLMYELVSPIAVVLHRSVSAFNGR